MAKLTMKGLNKQLDDYWKLAVKIKYNWKCVYCGETHYVNAHHIFGRVNRSVRWDLDNGLCLCPLHHTLGSFSAHQSPEFVDWIKGYIGIKEYNELMTKANTIKKWTYEEKEELLAELKAYTKEND